MWISILLSEPKLMALVYAIANMAPSDPANAKYESSAQAAAFKILRRLGNFPSNEAPAPQPTPGQRFLQQEQSPARMRKTDMYSSTLKSASASSMKESIHAKAAFDGGTGKDGSVGSVYSSGSKGAMKKMGRMFTRSTAALASDACATYCGWLRTSHLSECVQLAQP